MKRIPQYKTNVSTFQDLQVSFSLVWVTTQFFLLVDKSRNHFDLGFSFLKLLPQKLNLPLFGLILDLQHVERIWSFRVFLSFFYHKSKRWFTFVRCDLRLRWLKIVYRIVLWGRGQVSFQIRWSIRYFVVLHNMRSFFFLRCLNRYLLLLRILLSFCERHLFWCFELRITFLLVVCLNGISVSIV